MPKKWYWTVIAVNVTELPPVNKRNKNQYLMLNVNYNKSTTAKPIPVDSQISKYKIGKTFYISVHYRNIEWPTIQVLTIFYLSAQTLYSLIFVVFKSVGSNYCAWKQKVFVDVTNSSIWSDF